MKRLLLGACLLALAGCGGGPVEVRGKVTYEGKPVDNGTITFEPADAAGPSKGGPITNGEYQLTGPHKMDPGPRVVRIQAFGPSGRKVSAAPGSRQMVDEYKQHIPARYNVKSTLKVTVEAGKENRFDFDLQR